MSCHQVRRSQTLRSAHSIYLCVLCESQNKQRLFPYTALIDWFCIRDRVCLLRGTDWVFIYNSDVLKVQWSLSVPPGLTFTNSAFCPHSVFMCFVWISEQTAIISLYNINWLVFIAESESVHTTGRRDGPRGSGKVKAPDFLTFDTTRVEGRQPHAPATFTPRGIPGIHF